MLRRLRTEPYTRARALVESLVFLQWIDGYDSKQPVEYHPGFIPPFVPQDAFTEVCLKVHSGDAAVRLVEPGLDI